MNKVLNMSFNKLYGLLIQKALKKNRTIEEVYTVTSWLFGYSHEEIIAMMDSDITYGEFIAHAPCINPNAHLITGKICGISVENIEDPTEQLVRYLDKLVDELAKGKPVEKILRK